MGVEAVRLQHAEVVHALAVQLVGGRDVAQVEQEHWAEGGRVQVEAENAATEGERAGERALKLVEASYGGSIAQQNLKDGTWPVGGGRAYWLPRTVGTAQMWKEPAGEPAVRERGAGRCSPLCPRGALRRASVSLMKLDWPMGGMVMHACARNRRPNRFRSR